MRKDYKYGFRAKRGRDDVIIDWLERIQPSDKSYYIREVLRDYLTKSNFQDSIPADVLKSNSAVSNTNSIEPKKHEKADVENSISALEENLNSWID